MDREHHIKLENAVSTAELIETIDRVRTAIVQVALVNLMKVRGDDTTEAMALVDQTDTALDELRGRLRGRTLLDLTK